MKQSSGSLLERLRCCWYILTMRNYYVSCYAEDMIQEGEGGMIDHPKPGSIKGYYHIDEDLFVSYREGVTESVTLRDLICESMIHVITKIKERKL